MSHLLQPLITPSLELHNRLVMPPMATQKATDDGGLSDELLAYYDEKSHGGALGLVITEHSYITQQGRNRISQPSIAQDSTIEGWRRLTEVLHRNGSKAVMQINHSGGACSTAATGLEVVSASDLPSPVGPGETPRPLSAEEIAVIVGEFGSAARRAREAGFDGVEIHAAHGYLLNQFYSPLLNTRTDEYGGSLENRIRFHLEVIAAVRSAVGADFPVLLRLGACDYRDGGTTPADSVTAALAFERAGIDLIDITGGIHGYLRPDHSEPGYFAELSAPIKAAVSIPVILTGGITQPAHAEQLLAHGAADLIGVGRALLKDSGWAQRAVRELAE